MKEFVIVNNADVAFQQRERYDKPRPVGVCRLFVGGGAYGIDKTPFINNSLHLDFSLN